MEFFAASFTTVIIRFYLMMAVVIAALFSGLYPLALLALPLFLSAITAVRFRPVTTERVATTTTTTVVNMPVEEVESLRAA